MSSGSARYPGLAPIDAYGNGGFRFAQMSHRGSILCLPSGIYAWPVSTVEEIDSAALVERDEQTFLGTGDLCDGRVLADHVPGHDRGFRR